MNDKINPSHYQKGKMETIEIIQAMLTDEEFEGYLKGNIIKYTARYKYKNGVEDLKKSEWYQGKLIEVNSSES